MIKKAQKRFKNEGVDKKEVEKSNIAWREWQNYKKIVAKFKEKETKVSGNTGK